MNNTQFRSLLLGNNGSGSSSSPNGQGRNVAATPSQRLSATPMLGSRARSSIPMTPRSVAGYNSTNDFARQLAEHKRELSGQPPTKKFRSSAAPKGTKLAQGYQDRTSLRRADGEDTDTRDDKQKRLKALEEMMKLQQIDQSTFERLRDEIGVGGDVSSTHLIKGLDWKLLERVKKGEDINASPSAKSKGTDVDAGVDVDEELENVLEKEVQAVQKEQKAKKGEMAHPPSESAIEGQRMSRDEILQKLKANRTLNKQEDGPPPIEPSLGERFKKVGSGDRSEKKRFTEVVNGRRREVLITTDKDGRTKRKVRWLDKEAPAVSDIASGESAKQVLGMEVPAELAAKHQALLLKQQEAEDEDDDIFGDVGADYNPLADISDASDDESRSDGDIKSARLTQAKSGSKAESTTEVSKQKPRNYFPTKAAEEPADKSSPLTSDPAIMAALKRAAKTSMDQDEVDSGGSAAPREDQDPEKLLRQKKFLENLKKRDREDAMDMDLGFGESRFGDEEDEDGPLWEGEESGKKSGRKRRPKKRKGDKDSINDVMGVLAGRKAPEKK
jgi:hypothetical protein